MKIKASLIVMALIACASESVTAGKEANFIPTQCSVGMIGGSMQGLGNLTARDYFWATNGGAYYCLGRLDDGAAKARLSVCLAAQALGRNLHLVMNQDANADATGYHTEVPEEFGTK